MSLYLHNIGQLVQVTSEGELVLCGSSADNIAVLPAENTTTGTESPSSTRYAIVVKDGKIAALGSEELIASVAKELDKDARRIDCNGNAVLPGLIDAHTHPVWAGSRVHEFKMKLAGATYLDIHKAGGGIQFTVKKTREATEDKLLELLRPRLKKMLKTGTTTAEAKSGYGLNAETELKMLRVLHRASKEQPIELSATFLGAHSVPVGSTPEQATKDVIEIQLPAVIAARDAGEISVENCDIFVEKGIFNVEQSRAILLASKKAGLRVNIHGDELNNVGASELAAEVHAHAISHVEEISKEGIAALSEAKVLDPANGDRQCTHAPVAVVLPTTAHVLRLSPPPVRELIEASVPVALGSDFNPNAHCTSMPHAMLLACLLFRMSMNEALSAATINAAASIGRSQTHGSLEVGKHADILVLHTKTWESLIYCQCDPPIRYVIKSGNVVWEDKE